MNRTRWLMRGAAHVARIAAPDLAPSLLPRWLLLADIWSAARRRAQLVRWAIQGKPLYVLQLVERVGVPPKLVYLATTKDEVLHHLGTTILHRLANNVALADAAIITELPINTGWSAARVTIRRRAQ